MPPTSQFQPSRYQQAIFDFITQGTGNAVIEAVAGSGKSTTILQAQALIPRAASVAFLAFNKDIATVLNDRLRAMGCTNAEAMTLNAMGNRSWCKFKGVGRNNVDGNKLNVLARGYRDELQAQARQTVDSKIEEEANYVKQFLYMITNLVRKAKVNGMAPQDVPGVIGLIADTDEEWEKLIEHYGLEFAEGHRSDHRAIKAARVILRRSVADHDTIDFDDQFYLPLIYNAPFTKYDWVFIDEAQDVSDIQREILTRVMKPASRLVAVGDPFQSIYGFRGANPESLNLITQRFNATCLPLSISYRCSKEVVKFAKDIVPHIEPSDTAVQGSVTDLGEKFDLRAFKADDMILCRNTAPLVSLAYELISQRIPCLVKGRDIGQGLIKLVDKLKAVSMDALRKKLDIWEQEEVQRLLKKDEDANTDIITDKADSLRVFVDSSKAKSAEELKNEIRTMFRMYTGADEWKNDRDDKTPEDILTLSTIHKAKGLEAPRVFILNWFLMPSKYAKKEWEKIQEANLQYVAVTRAKRDLVFIDRKKKKEGTEENSAYVTAKRASSGAPRLGRETSGGEHAQDSIDREIEELFEKTKSENLADLQVHLGEDD
jgi:superfamily I DNA/RNA helicase